MEHITIRLVKIAFFVALWGISSRILIVLMKRNKPGLKIHDPEVLFPSVLASVLVTKLVMLALAAVTNMKP